MQKTEWLSLIYEKATNDTGRWNFVVQPASKPVRKQSTVDNYMETDMKRLWLLLPVLLLLPFAGDFAFSAATPGDSQVSENKEEPKGWLGVMLKQVKKKIAGKTDIEESKGAYVSDVIDDSPADKAGIEAGDIIIAFDNIEIDDPSDLTDAMRETKPGDMAKVTILRGDKQMTMDVKLGESKGRKKVIVKKIRMPQAAKGLALKKRYQNQAKNMRFHASPDMIWHSRGLYGFQLETLNEQLGEYFGAPEGEGVLIKKVVEDSDAAKAGFKAGDVIIKAGKKTVEETGDFKHVLGAYDAGENIPVQILRKGKKMTIDLTAKEAEDHDMLMERFELGGPNSYRFFHRGDDFEGLEDLEDMDIDIDIDMDELHDGVKEMRIMLNGKELELDELQDELREHLEELHEDVDVEIDDDENGKRVRIRTKKI